MARWAAVLAVALALVWPSAATAFAAAGLTPEQSLARDIALSLCGGDSGRSGETGHDGKPCDLCILCRTLAAAAMQEDVESSAAVPLLLQAASLPAAGWHVPACHPLDDATGPPTGPPRHPAA